MSNEHYARRLRAHATPMERRLWFYLRHHPLPAAFRHQVVLGRYVVDFASHPAKLIVELDGPHHEHRRQDVERDLWLAARGWEVVRYWNHEVRYQLEGVLWDIEARLKKRLKASAGPDSLVP